MNKGIIKCLKNSIGEKGNYCYSLPVETTKAVIKELNRLNNIINELEKYIRKEFYIVGNSPKGSFYEGYDTCLEEMKQEILNKLKELKENNK